MTAEESAKIDDRLRTDLAETDPNGDGVIGISEVSQIKVMPFPRMLQGFQVSPHRSVAIAGILGCFLLLGALLWCILVPRALAVNTQWKDSGEVSPIEPLRIFLQNDDGSYDNIDFSEPTNNNTKPTKSEQATPSKPSD